MNDNDQHTLCSLVDEVIDSDVSVSSSNLGSYYLWHARSHGDRCEVCRKKHFRLIDRLSEMIDRGEALLALEMEEIRGTHIREATEITRRAIHSSPPGSIFSLDRLLLEKPSGPPVENPIENSSALELIKSLAEAGGRVKNVFEAVHGQGLVRFNVVPDLDDEEQEIARRECAGLIGKLSVETRVFVFSAALAEELALDLNVGGDDRPQRGIHLGVLYKVIQAAAPGYIEAYVQSTGKSVGRPEVGGRGATTIPAAKTDDHDGALDRLDSLYEAQTVLMDVQTGLIERIRVIEELCGSKGSTLSSQSLVDDECNAFLQNAIGEHFKDLAMQTRYCLLEAERHHRYPSNQSDYTPAVLFLMKAFEFEFRERVVSPLLEALECLTMTDSTFKGSLPQFTLGQFRALFRKYRVRTEAMLEDIGLRHADLCDAIEIVNQQKGAKHQSIVRKEEAEGFRREFLSGQSVFRCLFPAT